MGNACQKIGYPTQRRARHRLRQLKAHRRSQFAAKCEDHAYRCTVCGRYHLTSQTRRS